MTLAACCGDVKFYRWCDMELLGTYEAPGGGVVGSISWRCEGKSLLATSDSGVPVLLGAPAGADATTVDPYDAVDVGGCAVVGTCSNSAADLACFGLEDGEVLAYDLGTKRRLFSVHTRLPGGVRHLRFSPDDASLAVGAPTDVFVLDSRWRPRASLALAAGSTLTSLAYGEAALCGGSDRGVVTAWDPETVDDVATAGATHDGPVADLAFVGRTLCSVGPDGRIRAYDVRSMTLVVLHGRTEAPLSSIAYMGGTYEVAVGSEDGRLFGYDLRDMSAPVRSVVVGREPVRRIAFPNTAEDLAFFSEGLRRRRGDEEMSASGDFGLGEAGGRKGCEGLAAMRDGSRGEEPTTVGSLPSPPTPPSLRRVPSTATAAAASEELDELTGLLEGTLRSVEEVFDERLEQVFHGMTASASRTFIDIEARLGRCWGHVVDFLGVAGEELARKAKEAGDDGRLGSYSYTETSTSN